MAKAKKAATPAVQRIIQHTIVFDDIIFEEYVTDIHEALENVGVEITLEDVKANPKVTEKFNESVKHAIDYVLDDYQYHIEGWNDVEEIYERELTAAREKRNAERTNAMIAAMNEANPGGVAIMVSPDKAAQARKLLAVAGIIDDLDDLDEDDDL